jgi:predicted cobalt transporter CbtA
MVEIYCGVGKHIAVIQANQEHYRTLLKARQIHMIAVVAGISLAKISISLLLLRLVARRVYQWFLWGMVGFMIAFMFACMGTLGMLSWTQHLHPTVC